VLDRGRETPVCGPGGADEARIVTAYLRRRQVAVEAAPLRAAGDLLGLAERVAGAHVASLA
jgi:hypothetical protein